MRASRATHESTRRVSDHPLLLSREPFQQLDPSGATRLGRDRILHGGSGSGRGVKNELTGAGPSPCRPNSRSKVSAKLRSTRLRHMSAPGPAPDAGDDVAPDKPCRPRAGVIQLCLLVLRGRPPLNPFLRAAAAFAGDDLRPPIRPSSASHSGPANTEERRPGTLRSRSRLSQCRSPPRPSISTARISRGVARLRSGISLTGNVIAAPFVSAIFNACPFGRYTMALARGSVRAARLPARDARAKFSRSSFSIHRVVGCDLCIVNQTLGLSGAPQRSHNCPKFE